MQLLWEQQPGETGKQYKAFIEYLNLGYERTVPKLAIKLGKKTVTYLYEWSSKNQWQARVRAWESEQLRVQKQVAFDSLKKVSEAQLKQASHIRGLLSIPIAVLLERLKPDEHGAKRAIEDLEALSTTALFEMIMDATKSLDTIAKLERLILNVPTDIFQTESTNINRSTEKFGELVAGDEKTTELLTNFLNALADSKDSKSDQHGVLSE